MRSLLVTRQPVVVRLRTVLCNVNEFQTLTFVEVRVRVAEAAALGEPGYGLHVHARVVERAVLRDQAHGLVGRQTFRRAQALTLHLDRVRAVALFAASVKVDPVLRAIADVRTRVVHR